MDRPFSHSKPFEPYNMNYLTLENIKKSYGEKVLFRGLGLQVNKGQKIALVAKAEKILLVTSTIIVHIPRKMR